MQIIDLIAANEKAIEQTAQLLFESFEDHAPEAWPTIDAALEEVHESLGEERISRVAIDDDGSVIGWVGGSKEYDGKVWELHPLAVAATHRRQGIGRALVADLEAQARARGGITIMLGTDDEDNRTTLGGVDLYPAVWQHINAIKNLNNHPYEFYCKLGFVIVGVIPDANGLGKPDIFMAKRIAKK